MMTPLEQRQRAEGGKARMKTQTDEERKFQAMLAASGRPLWNDARKSPEQIVSDFLELANSFKWLYLFIVGPDRSKIGHRVDKDVMLRKVKEWGGSPMGFLGLTVLVPDERKLTRPSLHIFYKPLKKGTKVVADLRSEGRELTALAIEALHTAQLPELKDKD